MYVISLHLSCRRWGLWLKMLLIACAVLWALFALYKWLLPTMPVLDIPGPVFPLLAGSFGVC